MKKKLFIVIVCTAFLFACTKTNQNLVIIKGEITNPIGKAVFFKSSDTIYSTTTNDNGTFEITFSLDSSKYITFNHGVEETAMYVKPGDNIYLTIDTRQFDETINYQGSPASSFLARKYLWRESTDFKGNEYYKLSFDEYKAFLAKYKLSLFDELGAVNDSSFINNQMNKIEKEISYYVGDKEQLEEWLADYGEDVRVYLWERKKLDKRYDFDAAIDSLNSSEFDAMLNEYSDSMNFLLSNVTNDDYVKEAKKNKEKNVKWWRERKVNTDNIPGEGEPAIDFIYPDKEGTEFSLSSFKGKLVYVDVWATWCGPCIGEIPDLQKLEQEYQGKNIVFISISIDENKNAWLNMVEEKELGGLQLWAGNLSKGGSMEGITKDYAIYAIPRFMLFSQDGKVISTDAPRPSSSAIRGLLDAYL